MKSKKQKYNLWSLIVIIFNFFRGWQKQETEEQQKLNEKLKDKYEGIDKEKEEKQKQDVEDRLNNMF